MTSAVELSERAARSRGPVPCAIGELLDAAARSGDAVAQAKAARIRQDVEELAAYLALAGEVESAHARISQLGDEVAGLRVMVMNAVGATKPAAAAGSRPQLAPDEDPHCSPTVREWARAQGMTVSDHGRLSDKVLAAWDKAQPETQ